MTIVDAQVHIWYADSEQRPWPTGTKGQKPYEVTRDAMLFQMDLAGVDRAIIVPPSWEGERNVLRAFFPQIERADRLPTHTQT